MYSSKANIKVKSITINVPKIQDYHHEVQEAVREVYKDRIICAYAGYKRASFKLSTKAAVAKAVVDGHITVYSISKLLNMGKITRKKEPGCFSGYTKQWYPNQNLRNWIKDYKQGKLRLENACAIRRV